MEGVVRRGIVAGWIASSFGCTSGPTGPPDTGGDDLPYADLTIGDTFAAICATEGSEPEFTAASTRPGGFIDVVHTGYEYPDCGTYTVFVDRPELRRLVLDYGRIGDTAEECSETCVWSFTYVIKVDAGEWVLELLNTHDKVTVIVP